MLGPESKAGAVLFDETPALGPEYKAGVVLFDETPALGPESKAGAVFFDETPALRVNVTNDKFDTSNNPRSVWVKFQQPGWSSV